MRYFIALSLFALVTVIAPRPGAACGDRLVVQGGGVRLDRIVHSRHPGSILLLALSATASGEAGERLSSALRQAGHDVRLVTSTAALDRALRERHADVVLAELTAVPSLRTEVAALDARSAIVPVVYRPTRAELAGARQQFACVATVAGWGVSPVLKVVDQVRARQTAGEPVDCFGTAQATT